MLDLIFGYLIIIVILLSANVGLFLGNYNFNNIKSTLIFVVLGILFIIDINISRLFSLNLLDYLTHVFLIIFVIVFIILLTYLKLNKLKKI